MAQMMQTTTAARQHARRIKIKPAQIVLYATLLAGAVVVLFPIYWMGISTLKSEVEINAYPPTLLPHEPTLQPLVEAWTQINLKQLFANSLFLTSVITPIAVMTSAWIGFVLAKYEFRGRDLVFLAIMSTMMIPGSMLLIPRYQVAVWLKLVNTHTGIILPGLLTPFGIFLMRQFMHAMPNELLEAARMDGASEPRIFVQVVLPLVHPALAALGIFEFLGHWDDLLWPLVILNNQRLFTIPLGLALLQGELPTYAMANAAAFIAILPVVTVFLVFQRHIIRSITLTGMGGT